MKPQLTLTDFARAALNLGVPTASVRAVETVECPAPGFDTADEPKILFEGHRFSEATNGRFDSTHPAISYPNWTREFYAKGPNADVRNRGEHKRLALAVTLDRDAALASASWGKFQIMGFNYALAGFSSLQAFINAMYQSESAQLDAFVNFIQNNKAVKNGKTLHQALKDRDWATFARIYNGPSYKENSYDTKLADAYKKYSK